MWFIWIIIVASVFLFIGWVFGATAKDNQHREHVCQCEKCLRDAEADPVIDNLVEAELAKQVGRKLDVKG